MTDVKAQMKEYVKQAARLSKEAGIELDKGNFAEGRELWIKARESAHNFQRLYQSKQASGAN